MTFAKYEFTPEKWAELKPTIQDNDAYVNCAVHEIGHICRATDEQGNCTDLSPMYAVDIMWFEDIPEAFSTFEVFPNPIGVHTFAGCEALYTQRFCEFNPLSPYCETI